MNISKDIINLFNNCNKDRKALTFDEITFEDKPASIHPNDIIIESKFTRNIVLRTPIVSSCMDTVTEGVMALEMAKNGGIGIIHRNMCVDDQVNIIKWVRNKIHNGGMIEKPITFNCTDKVSDIHNSINENCWQFTNFPILNGNKLVGMVSRNELEFVEDLDPNLGDIMIKLDKLVVIGEDYKGNIYDLMKAKKVKKLPVVDNEDNFIGMYTWKDIMKNESFKCKYSLDSDGKFLVGVAVGIGEKEKNRVDILADNGCKVIVIDTSHGACSAVIDMLDYIKDNYPQIQVIVGNIASYESTVYLISTGKYKPDALRVGISVGSICTTRRVTGHGMPQLTAIHNVWRALNDYNMTNIPIIADGGIRFSGDIVKALAVGASCVMLGNVLAGTDESPGKIVINNGHKYKIVRGMGSRSAMEKRSGSGSRSRYFSENTSQLTINQKSKLVPEGIEGLTKYRGPLSSVLNSLIGGIKAGMGHSGAHNINDFRKKATMWTQSNVGVIEANPHGLEKIIDD